MKAKVNLIQFNPVYKCLNENIMRMDTMFGQVDKVGLDLVVLPELWTSGYSTEIFHDHVQYAQSKEDEAVSLMQEKARLHNTWIIAGSILEHAESGYYNTSFIINREGEVVGKYRKMHLYSPMDEDLLNYGQEMPVFSTDFGRVAIMNCYDIRFVEMSRAYALMGADMIIIVSNWAAPKLNHWRTMVSARAIENQLVVVACNRVGATPTHTYFGHSLIVDPWGEVIIEDSSEQERVISGVVDLGKVGEVRKEIPMYLDRKPELYSKFSAPTLIEKL